MFYIMGRGPLTALYLLIIPLLTTACEVPGYRYSNGDSWSSLPSYTRPGRSTSWRGYSPGNRANETTRKSGTEYKSPSAIGPLEFVARYEKSVVTIYNGRKTGTGFFIGKNLIATCHHVIDESHLVFVQTYSGEEFVLNKIIADDADADFAVFTIKKQEALARKYDSKGSGSASNRYDNESLFFEYYLLGWAIGSGSLNNYDDEYLSYLLAKYKGSSSFTGQNYSGSRWTGYNTKWNDSYFKSYLKVLDAYRKSYQRTIDEIIRRKQRYYDKLFDAYSRIINRRIDSMPYSGKDYWFADLPDLNNKSDIDRVLDALNPPKKRYRAGLFGNRWNNYSSGTLWDPPRYIPDSGSNIYGSWYSGLETPFLRQNSGPPQYFMIYAGSSDTKSYPPLKLSGKTPRYGEELYVIGRRTASGIDYRRGKYIGERNFARYGTVYMTTAQTIPGFSGSPVINSNGEVVGVVSFNYKEGSDKLSGAVPAGKIISACYHNNSEPADRVEDMPVADGLLHGAGQETAGNHNPSGHTTVNKWVLLINRIFIILFAVYVVCQISGVADKVSSKKS